jgi:hypothetical protein
MYMYIDSVNGEMDSPADQGTNYQNIHQWIRFRIRQKHIQNLSTIFDKSTIFDQSHMNPWNR